MSGTCVGPEGAVRDVARCGGDECWMMNDPFRVEISELQMIVTQGVALG
jgi:hypothetical protein